MRATRSRAALVARRAIAVLVAGAMTIPIAVGVSAGVASATPVPATYTVATYVDGTGSCSTPDTTQVGNPSSCPTFRAAVTAANANPKSTIVVPPGDYKLTSEGPTISAAMTLVGAGAVPGTSASTLDGSSLYRVLTVSAAVVIRGLVIANGAPASGNGGGVAVTGTGVLTLNKSTIMNSRAASGGGLSVASGGSATVSQSTISNNAANSKGGGIYSSGTLSVQNSTIDSNIAKGGGGIASGGTASVVAGTVYANASIGDDGGGVYRVGGSFTMSSSILSDNTSTFEDDDCYDASITFIGVNDVHWPLGCTPVGILTADPKLGPLADNGGGTLTRLPLPGSPVKDVYAGPCATAVDQRDVQRPQGSGCELGSVEVAPLTVSLQLTTDSASVPSGAGAVPVVNLPNGVFVPPAAGTDPQSAPLHSAPLHSAPLHSAPLHSAALHSAPLHSAALHSAPLHSAALHSAALHSAPLHSAEFRVLALISLADVTLYLDPCPAGQVLTAVGGLCGSWPDVLRALDADGKGTNFAPQPLQDIHLSDIYAYSEIQALTLDQIDLSNTPLGSVPLSAYVFDGPDISTIGLTPGLSTDAARMGAWCAAPNGTACTGLGIDLTKPATFANISLLDFAYAGGVFDNLPFGQVPLSSFDLTNTAFAGVSMSALVSAGATVVRSLVDCTNAAVVCTLASAQTMADAISNHALAAGATIDTALFALFDPYDLPVQGINLDGGPISNLASPLVTPFNYTATATVGGNIASSAVLDLQLPAEFVVANAGADSAPPIAFDATPVAACAASGVVAPCWSMNGQHLLVNVASVSVGAHSITVKARAGLQTGTQTANALFTATDTSGTKSANASAGVNVVDAFQSVSGGQPIAISPGLVYVAHVSGPTETDLYSFQAPPLNGASFETASVTVANMSVDLDAVMYGSPLIPLRGKPTTKLLSVDSSSVSVNPLNDSSAPDVVQDVRLTPDALPDGQPHSVVGISDQRGTTDEHIDNVLLVPGARYYVQVTGFNGATSSAPYTLQLRLSNTVLPACSQQVYAPSYGSLVTDPASTLPDQVSSLPDKLDTLYLVAPDHIQAMPGGNSATVMSALAQVTGSTPVSGTIGGVVNLDADANVRNAWDAATNGWDSNRCSPDLANGVVRAIGQLITAVQNARPSLRYVVLVGGDEVLPMGRTADKTAAGNERGYASEFRGNSQLVGSLAESFVQTDDVYATSAGIDLGGSELFVPQLAVGRLVGTSSDIANAIIAFKTSGGLLDPSTAQSGFVTGYDFLAGGANAVFNNLTAIGLKRVTGLVDNKTLTYDSASGAGTTVVAGANWSATDLRNQLTKAGANPAGIISLNGHYDQANALSAADNAAHVLTDPFTVADISGAATSLSGHVVYTAGCHAGLTASADILGTPLPTWSTAYGAKGAVFIGNTGFGFGDDAADKYSALLGADFAGQMRLNGSVSVGAALSAAKRQYLSELPVLSDYDAKSLQEFTYYGMPMYRIPGSPASAAAATVQPVLTTDPATHLQVASFTLTPTFTFHHTLNPDGSGNGDYYDANGRTINTQNRPVEPLVIQDATVGGKVARGVIITGLTSSDHGAPSPGTFLPHIDRPSFASTSGSLPPGIGDAAFPSSFGRVSTVSAPDGTTTQTLALAGGQFRPDGPSNPGLGTQRLFDSITATVLYADANAFSDVNPPQIQLASGDVAIGTNALNTAHFSVTTDTTTSGGSTAIRMLLLYRGDQDTGTWKSLDLVNTQNSPVWTGTAPTSSSVIEFFVQAVGPSGLVGVSDKKVDNYQALTIQAPGTVMMSVTPGTSYNNTGWYQPVGASVAITCSSNNCGQIQYRVDGGALNNYSQPVPVSGDGPHIVQALTGGTLTQISVPIDALPPAVSVTPSNVADPAHVEMGSSLGLFRTANTGPGAALVYDCVDTESGLDPSGGCVATLTNPSGSVVDPAQSMTNQLGTWVLSIASRDAVGNAATPLSFAYTVVDTTKPVVTLDPLPAQVDWGTALSILPSPAPQGAAPSALYSCDDGKGSGIASCTLAVLDPNNNPVQVVNGVLPTTTMLGPYTVTVTATDKANINPAYPNAVANMASASTTYKVVDNQPPIIAGSAPDTVEMGSPFHVAPPYAGAAPFASYSCSPGLAALISCIATPSRPDLSTPPIDGQGLIPTDQQGLWSLSVTATDAATLTNNKVIQWKVVDTTPPTETINLAPSLQHPPSPNVEWGTNTLTIAQAGSAAATSASITYACDDGSGSGVAMCAATVTDPMLNTTSLPDGSALPSNMLGTFVVTVTGTDKSFTTVDGKPNTSTRQFSYKVVDTEKPAIRFSKSSPQPVEMGSPFVVSHDPLDSDNRVVFSCADNESGIATGGCVAAISPPLGGNLNNGATSALGDWVVTVTATDNAGNVSTGAFTYHVQDTTPPTASVVLPTNPVEWGSTVPITMGASGLAHYSCSDGVGSGIASCAVTVLDPKGHAVAIVAGALPTTTMLGLYTVTVTATDNVGLTFSASATYTVHDSVPPTVQFSGPSAVEMGSSFNAYRDTGSVGQVIYKCADAGSGLAQSPINPCAITLITDPSGGTNYATAGALPTSMEGTWILSVTAIDLQGNVTTSEFPYLVADHTPPSGGGIAFTTDYTKMNGYTNGLSVGLAVTQASDPGGTGVGSTAVLRASAVLSNGTCQAFSGFGSVTLVSNVDSTVASGNCYQYEYTATDKANPAYAATSPNTATWTTGVVKVDAGKPDAVITPPTKTKVNLNAKVQATLITWGTVGSTSAFNYACRDTLSGLQVGTCTLAVTAPGSSTVTVLGTPTAFLPTNKVGTYNLALTATDLAGNTTTTTSSYTVVYKICYEYNTSTKFSLTGTASLDVEVCDDAGVNLSASTHLELSTKVDTTLTPSTNVISGKSYGYQWYFNSTSKWYHFNLNAKQVAGIRSGSHQLVFTVDGVADPSYTAPFTLQ